MISTFLVIYIQYTKPLDSRSANRMAVLNEVTVICVCYCLMYFTDFVDEAELRNDFGKLYITILFLFTFTHFFFIIWETGRETVIRMRYYWNWRIYLYYTNKLKAK